MIAILARLAPILADGHMPAFNQARVSAVLLVTPHQDGVFPGDRSSPRAWDERWRSRLYG